MPFKNPEKRKEYNNSEAHKESMRKWQTANRKKLTEYISNWRKANPEKYSKICRKYRAAHKEKAILSSMSWRKNNPEKSINTSKNNYRKHRVESLQRGKEWKLNNLDKYSAYHKNWRKVNEEKFKNQVYEWRKNNPEKCRGYRYERNRNLGNNLLNNPFGGCHRHHITKNDIICIPKDIHTAYKHNHKKPDTMKKINILAWDVMRSGVY